MFVLQTAGRLALAASLFFQSCSGLPVDHSRLEDRASGSLASFIASESPIALQGVLNNIGDTGSKAPGARAGITIASPSTSNPNCTSPVSYNSVPWSVFLCLDSYRQLRRLRLPDWRCQFFKPPMHSVARAAAYILLLRLYMIVHK